MSISNEQAIGKVGVHLVCADLIEQGLIAFIVEEGLNYDVIADINGKVYRVQVKTTSVASNHIHKDKPYLSHRFYLGNGKRSRRIEHGDVDVFAFVALDLRAVAYIPSIDLVSSDGLIKTLVEFRENSTNGKHFNEYRKFPSQDKIAKGYGGYNFSPRIDARLTMEQAYEIRKKYVPRKYPCARLAKEYGVSEPVIRQIISGRTYRIRQDGTD